MHRTRMHPAVASRSSILRTIFYALHTAIMEDESMQMNGLVLVMNVKCFNLLRDFDPLFIRKCTDLFTHALPVKVMAIHMCLASHGRNIFGVILPILKKIITKRVRSHVKFHSGHDSDLLRELMEHGISPESTHKALGGNYTDDMLTAWVKRHKRVEAVQAEEMAAHRQRRTVR